MTCTIKGLCWAAMTIAAAIAAKQSGMSDSASFAVIAGMLGAFFASNNRSAGCGSC